MEGSSALKIEVVKMVLDRAEFSLVNYEKEDELAQKNVEIWDNHNKVVFLKEYRSKTSFNKWLLEDQPLIATLYNNIPIKKRNNMYFILVLNFEDYTDDYDQDDDLHLKINKAQKNEYVCKKYVLIDDSDLEKIPFLDNDFTKGKSINYDESFRNTLFDSDIVEKLANEKGYNPNDFYKVAEGLIDYYFNGYDTDKNKENVFRKIVTEIRERE